MGYNSFKQVDYSNLIGNIQKVVSSVKNSGVHDKNNNDILCLDVIRFEYLDWRFQMIYASNLKNSSFPCVVNERAMEMLFFSSIDNNK
jgi:hypothetical protein